MSIKIDDHNDLRTCNRFRSTSIDFYGHQHALRKAEDRKKIRESQNGVIYLKRKWNRRCHGFRRHLDE